MWERERERERELCPLSGFRYTGTLRPVPVYRTETTRIDALGITAAYRQPYSIWHLESNSVLVSTQTGYWQFRSTEDQLALLTQDIEDAFREKKVLAVFFDLSKALDKVWKEGLLLKLLRAGVNGKMYKWLSEFLFNRTATVKLDGTISRQVKLKEGVPQGGVVSPTLFLVYMNDITTTVPRHVSNTLHADDCSMVRWRTYHHSCPPHLEYHQRGVQLDTTAQHNQDGLHSSHCPPQRRRSH